MGPQEGQRSAQDGRHQGGPEEHQPDSTAGGGAQTETRAGKRQSRSHHGLGRRRGRRGGRSDGGGRGRRSRDARLKSEQEEEEEEAAELYYHLFLVCPENSVNRNNICSHYSSFQSI